MNGIRIVKALIVVLPLGLICWNIPKMKGTPSYANVDAAAADETDLAMALDRFKDHCGRYPTSHEGLQALVGRPASDFKGWVRFYSHPNLPVDPWGNPYIYVSRGRDFHLICYGSDGRPGGSGEAADIIVTN